MRKFFTQKVTLALLRTVALRLIGGVALLVGLVGLGLLFLNPLPLAASIFPIPLMDGSYITYSSVQTLLNSAKEENVLAVNASIMGLVLLLGIGLLRKGIYNKFKALGRGIVASPKAIWNAPIRLYRKSILGRNWLLEKVEYLQEESAKWKKTFQIMRSPYSFLRMMGFSPQMAASFLIAGTAVGGGVAVNETILADRSFNRGDSGVYAASVIGGGANLDAPTEYIEGSNTLRIDLGSTPVREITIENVSVGTVFTGSALPSGEANVVQVSGNTISGGTNTRLEIGHLIFENSRCKKLTLTDIQAHTILVRGNASDGQSIAPSPGTSRMRAIGGGHQQADAMETNGGTYDRIWIQAPTSGVNGKIGTLRLSNLYTKGGDCILSKMNVGTMDILLNEVGMGNGFATKEFTIATTVTGANITVEDNVEVSIAEPVTAGH
tara:strand:+ start:3231 stop:4541 length:1311 start_codon:yes stop_codon:yes gene_type:complete